MKGNLKRKAVSLRIAIQNNATRTNNIKTKIVNSQNSE